MSGQVRERAPGVDVVIAGGSLAGLWLAMLLSAGMARIELGIFALFQIVSLCFFILAACSKLSFLPPME